MNARLPAAFVVLQPLAACAGSHVRELAVPGPVDPLHHGCERDLSDPRTARIHQKLDNLPSLVKLELQVRSKVNR